MLSAVELCGAPQVDVIDGAAERLHLFGGNRQPQLALGFGQRDPQAAPGGMDRLRRPEPAHFLRGVATDQRILILVVAQTSPFLTVSGLTTIEYDPATPITNRDAVFPGKRDSGVRPGLRLPPAIPL